MLCRSGAVVDAEDRAKTTSLFGAAKYNETECLKILLEFGANPNHQRYNLDTALHVAAANDAEPCLSILVGFGGSVDALNREGQMPKDKAKVKGHKRCFFALMKMERSLTLRAALEERDEVKPTTE